VYRDPRGTFTRSVTITFAVAVMIMFLVRGKTTAAVPYYGVGVFMPITVMGLAVRRHIQQHETGRKRTWGVAGATLAAVLAAIVFIGQLVGWTEGGWVVLITFSPLALMPTCCCSPLGYRNRRFIASYVRKPMSRGRWPPSSNGVVKMQDTATCCWSTPASLFA
jgi:peptidoglycan/LPS O-acetylase OafA/YrhL